jgi:hypothetical protein
MGGEVGGLSSDNFGGIEGNSSSNGRDSDGSGKHCGGGLKNGSSGGGGTDRQVCGSNTETINGIRNVVGALDEAVSVDVGVAAAGDAIGGTCLCLGAGAAGISISVLSEGILCVVLTGHRGSDANWSSGHVWCCIGQGTKKAGLGGGQSHQAGDDHLHRKYHMYCTPWEMSGTVNVP